MAKNIWVVGGDPRQAALARLLSDDGHGVHTYALEQAEGTRCEPSMDGADRADCMVLPLPAAGPDGLLNAPLSETGHTLEEVLAPLRPGQLVCAGMVGEPLCRMAEERGLILRDYFAREELAVLNAIPIVLAVSSRRKSCPAVFVLSLRCLRLISQRSALITRTERTDHPCF